MSLRGYLKRLLCPSCIEMESGHARRVRTVRTLERSGERLDRIAESLQTVWQRMEKDRNPILGERPERDC